MAFTSLVRSTAVSLCAVLIAVCTGCGGGDSGNADGGGGGPAQPPPTNTGIGAAGGTVSEASGAKVVIPAGALTTNTDIAVTQSSSGAPPLPAGVTAFGKMYAFTPHGTTFTSPVTITVPFDPGSVPPGTALALYKTNAAQTGWDVVSGATISGNLMVGDVSGFSFATVASVPTSQFAPTSKSWQAMAFPEDGPADILPLDPNQNRGGLVDVKVSVGGAQAIVPQGLSTTADTFEIFSNPSGRTFWTQAIAPHNTGGDPAGYVKSQSTLTQTFFFEVQQEQPSLRFVISKLRLEGIDEGGNAPSLKLCPWLAAQNLKPDEVAEACGLFMSKAHAAISIAAVKLDERDPFFTVGGGVEVQGQHQQWQFGAFKGGWPALWSNSDFTFNKDVEGNQGERHFLALLNSPLTVDVPISNLHPGDAFRVEVLMVTDAIDEIQGESFIGAFARDPLEDSGLELEITGLEQVPPTETTPISVAPVACSSGVNSTAGVLQFTRPDYSAPERADTAEVIVERVNGTAGDVSVHIATRDGSAKEGADYDALSTEIRFADGEGGQAVIEVPLVRDSVAEPDKTLDLELSGAGGCAALGSQQTATLTILDDDRPLPPPDTHKISGTVSGLTGTGLVVKNVNTGSSVAPTNGPFTLPDFLLDGESYDIRVDTQPGNPVQQCTIANGTGTIAGADVTNVQVTCAGLAPSGSLDPTFGTGGRVITNITAASNVFNSRMGMAVQADDRILIVGGLTLVRFNRDGSLDTTFGTGGQARVPFDGGTFDGAQDVAVQPDGKIVVIGVTDPGGQIGKEDFALARFNSDGTLDQSFGTGGKTSTDVAGNTDIARRVRIQPDGKILVAGHAIVQAAPSVFVQEFALVRYNSDGTPDVTFARGSGEVRDSAGRSFNEQSGLIIQSDGKIVLAGITADNGAAAPTNAGLIRYWGDVHPGSVASGDRDETFGALGNGTVESDLLLGSPNVEDAVLTADGTVFVGGQAAVGGKMSFFLSPFSSDGRLAGGSVVTQFTTEGDFAHAMLLQSNGKIVAVGQSAALGSNPDMAIVRYSGSGSAFAPDTAFGTDGKVTVDFFGGRDNAFGAVQQSDGKLVVGGLAQNGQGIFVALARLAQ